MHAELSCIWKGAEKGAPARASRPGGSPVVCKCVSVAAAANVACLALICLFGDIPLVPTRADLPIRMKRVC